MVKTCIICGSQDGCDSHHITPIAYNGPIDGPQVILCSTHHRKIHTAAGKVYKGDETFVNLFSSDDELKSCTPLIQGIVNARIVLESSGRKPDTVRRLMIQIPTNLYLALHQRKQDLGFSSLEKFLITALTSIVNK